MRTMRAVPLVRAWLYGFRGFVVMTASLAIAFSVAITGPPTNTELDIVTEAFAARAAAFGEELEAAAVQLCPSLPNEVQMLCGAAPAPAPAEEAPPAPPKPPPPVDLTAHEVAATQLPANVDAELLGAPSHVQRAQPVRRATTQRTPARPTSAQRPAANRQATPPRRATGQRRATPTRAAPRRAASNRPTAERIRAAQQAAQGDLSRGLSRRAESPAPAPPVETVSRGDDSAQVLSDMERATADYAEFEAAEAAEYRREQAERREERRRRWRERRRAEYERVYGTPYPEDDYEEAPYRDPERDPDDGW